MPRVCTILCLVSSLSIIHGAMCNEEICNNTFQKNVENEGNTVSCSSQMTLLYSEIMFFHLSCNKICWQFGWVFVLLLIYLFKK